jgi:UDP-3-O-[3-hydroxymyristoyl] N-acetylglucosamine deacetylase
VGLDNILIEIDGFEVPILDGSALPFAQVILDAGLQEQSVIKKYVTSRQVLRFEDSKTDRFIEIVPAIQASDRSFACELKIDYSADFNHKLIGASNFNCVLTQDFFIKEIAPARTFGFLEQLPMIRKHGLAKGTSLGNTVVLSNEGFLNEPRFEDECIRHKVLDLIGDLGLLGLQLIGQVKACKTGHNFNREVVASFISNPEKWQVF